MEMTIKGVIIPYGVGLDEGVTTLIGEQFRLEKVGGTILGIVKQMVN